MELEIGSIVKVSTEWSEVHDWNYPPDTLFQVADMDAEWGAGIAPEGELQLAGYVPFRALEVQTVHDILAAKVPPVDPDDTETNPAIVNAHRDIGWVYTNTQGE